MVYVNHQIYISDDQVHCPHPISYESKINLQHFEDYLQEEKSKTAHLAPQELSKANVNNNRQRNAHEVNVSIDTHDEVVTVLPLLKTLLNHSDKGHSDTLGLPDPHKLALLLGILTGLSKCLTASSLHHFSRLFRCGVWCDGVL